MTDQASPQSDQQAFGFGLTEAAVRELQDIIAQDCGVHLSFDQAWRRAIELLALTKLLLESLPPRS